MLDQMRPEDAERVFHAIFEQPLIDRERKIAEAHIRAKEHLESTSIEAFGNCLLLLYNTLDEFSFSGANRVPELCYWLAHRLLDRLGERPDGALDLLGISAELRSAAHHLDKEGIDVLRLTGARGGEPTETE